MAENDRFIRACFNPVFKEANQSKLRYRVFKGGAGSGKSYNIAQDYIIRLSDPHFAGANLLVCRKVDDSNKYSTYAELCGAVHRLFGDDYKRFWRITQNPMSMRSLVTGSEILFRGMQDIRQRDRVKSVSFPHGKLCWIWCEEATEFEQEDIEILDDRLRGVLDNPSLFYQITLSFNPVSASHWIKRRFFDISSPNVLLNHSTFLDNRFCDAGYAMRMEERRVNDPDGYRIYGLGDWGEMGGQIFTRFVVEPFDTDPERFDAMSIGQDFGYNHANAILTLGLRDGEIFICSEIYVFEKDTAEIITLADERGVSKAVKMWCDSAEPDRIKTWKRAGYRADGVKKEKGSVIAQIDWIKRRMVHIHPSCVNTLKEMQQWKWSKNRRSGDYEDEPVEAYDDAMAALRYGVEDWRKSLFHNRR